MRDRCMNKPELLYKIYSLSINQKKKGKNVIYYLLLLLMSPLGFKIVILRLQFLVISSLL